MGSCLCCFKDKENTLDINEPTERTTLLSNPVSNNINRPLYGEIYSQDVSTAPVPDEHAALNRILQQTTCDFIDVSALPPHLEKKEYLDRVTIYQKMLLTAQMEHIANDKPTCLLKDLSYPERVVMEPPLSLEDLNMMGDIVNEVQRSLQDVRVNVQADLVAQFGST